MINSTKGCFYAKISNAMEQIKEITQNELKQALDLAEAVFSEFVAKDFSEEGIKTFNDYLKTKYEEYASGLTSGDKKVWGYFKDGEIIGVLAVRNNSHIALMFVDKRHHRKGIAKKLFIHFLKEAEKDEPAEITVNSSPYAVPVYERLGFEKVSELQEKNGILFTHMLYDG